MPRVPELTFEEHMRTAEKSLAETEEHAHRMVGLLEDDTEFGAQVERLHAVLTLVQAEMSRIVRSHEKNNPR